MKILVDSVITIKNPTSEIKQYCKDFLTLKNPEIQKKKAMGFWTGNIKPTIYLYTKKNNDYILPIGCFDDIWKIYPHKECYENNMGVYKKIDFPEMIFKPYKYQEKAIEAMIRAKRGILKANCGSGKSICAINIIKRIGYKALIIVQTMEILNQFKNYCLEVMNLKKEDIGIIAAGKVEIGSKITLALRQTLCKVDLIQYKYEWGTIILDECQNISSNPSCITQYEKILNNLAAPYRISLSATPKRMDGLTNSMYALCGKVKHEITSQEVADKTIKAEIKPIYTNYEIPEECIKWDGTLDYIQLPTSMATNFDRNQLIVKYLKENKDNYCLILSDRLIGLENLHNLLGEGLLINGSMTSKKAKKEREEAVQKMREKKEHFLFSSFGIAKEGLDIKPLNRLFLIAPTKNSNVLIQSVGRIERKDDNKTTPIVYDFVDKDLYYQKAFKSRKTIYKKNGNILI